MNQVRNRLAALSLLDRALGTIDDDALTSSVEQLRDDLRQAFDQMVAMAAAPEATETAAAVRSAAQRGRLNGTLERISMVLSDACLEDCVNELGDSSDNPSDDELQAVIPGLIERHGLGTVRLMLASTVAGDAAAASVCTRLLKHDPVVALPAVPVGDVAPRPAPAAPDPEREALRQRRKEDRARKQAAERARREQAQRARRG